MRETTQDLEDLQALLDRSYESAGTHLLDVITPERRLPAAQLCERLEGMCLLVLATVSSDGRPFAGPVDGIFYRGAFHFSSSPDSLRIRHVSANPSVSATHLPREEFAVTVHGTANVLDARDPVHAELRSIVLDIYTPHYGLDWEAFFDANVFVRIDAQRMFTLAMD